MIRRERRAMQKKMGLTKLYKKLPLTKRMEMLREALALKDKAKEISDTNKRIEDVEIADESASNAVYKRAMDIIAKEKIPYIDAMQRAQKEIDAELNS